MSYLLSLLLSTAFATSWWWQIDGTPSPSTKEQVIDLDLFSPLRVADIEIVRKLPEEF